MEMYDLVVIGAGLASLCLVQRLSAVPQVRQYCSFPLFPVVDTKRVALKVTFQSAAHPGCRRLWSVAGIVVSKIQTPKAAA